MWSSQRYMEMYSVGICRKEIPLTDTTWITKFTHTKFTIRILLRGHHIWLVRKFFVPCWNKVNIELRLKSNINFSQFCIVYFVFCEAVRLPLFNLEDVLLTGFAASELDIPRINVTLFRNELENPFNMPTCKIVNIIAGMTDGSAAQIYHVWYNYLMGTVFCKYLKKLR